MRDDLPKPNMPGYDRPNQPWICGRMAEGDPCAFGPGERGVCPSKAECNPVEVDGEWQCDRPTTRGGHCDDGPTADGGCGRCHKCQPVRSLRTSRGVLVRSAMVFAAGLVLMLLGGSARNQWIAPGPLCSQHAQVLEGKSWEQRCATCHAAAEQAVGNWLSAVVGTKLGPTQSTKCLGCHDKTIDRERALDPHNVPAEFLASLVDPTGGNFHRDSDPQQLACSVCHQEHHGAEHDLAAMADQRCQSCHSQQYQSFAADHPEFTRWPYERRTRIAFNHATHMNKHFAENKQDFACQQCHVEDATGVVQLTLPYESSCASCHDQDIATSVAGGVTVFALPMLDAEWLAEEGHPIDNWPERATGDFDGRLPAVTKLLLAEDGETREAMELLGADFDFFDVDIDDDAQMQATARLANALQRLLDRMEQTDASEAATLVGLTSELVGRSRRAWLADEASEAPTNARPGTWWSDDLALALRYQPTGHADPVMKAWLDAIISLNDSSLREDLLTEFTGPGALGRCTLCHSIDNSQGNSFASIKDDADRLQINWKAHDRRGNARGFTRFSHGPHLLPVELRDCTACHAIDQNATSTGSYSGANAESFASEFAPVTKADCASCHQKGVVSDRCTDCHNYHVEW